MGDRMRINACVPIAAAFRRRAVDAWVVGKGRVTRVLSDDNVGSRHQRFIVDVKGGLLRRAFSVLVAHNIDLAKRVPLKVGSRVSFRGEYTWTERGGTLHWTHHDPAGWHDGGWIRRGLRTHR